MADLKRGSPEHEQIKKLQEQIKLLIEQAKTDHKIDALDNIKFEIPEEDMGIYGPRTETAVKQLQAALGHRLTGKADIYTQTGLDITLSQNLQQGRFVAKEPAPVTPAGRTFTQFMEGYSADKYHCSAGFSTIGYGTTWHKGMPKHIDQATAEQMMDHTYLNKYDFAKAKFGDSLDKLRPNERDAVLDLVYNLRPKSLGAGTIKSVQDLAACTDPAKRPALLDDVAQHIMSYDRHNPALQERRSAEVMLLRGEYDNLTAYMKDKKPGIDILEKGHSNGKKLGTPIPDFKQNYKPQSVPPSQVKQEKSPDDRFYKGLGFGD